MSLPRAFYPHAIDFPTAMSLTDVVQLEDVTARSNDTELIRSCASGFIPEYVGIVRSAPDVTFGTAQIADIFTMCTDENIARDLSAGVTDFYYRAGKPMGIREDDISAVHNVARLTNSGMVFWQDIRARDAEEAIINCSIVTAWDGTDDPMTFVGTSALSGTCNVSQLYTLGPVIINTVEVEGLIEWGFSSNVQLETIGSSGEPYIGYQGIRSYTPKLTVRTNDQEWAASTTADGGLVVTALDFYLRQFNRDSIVTPNATANHIKFSATSGLAKVQQVSGSPTETEIMITLEKPPAADIFTVNLASAIA
jgi:hypothetical protein